MESELFGIRSEQKLKENVQSMKGTDAGEMALRGQSCVTRLPKERNKITQKRGMDNILGNVSVCPGGVDTVATIIPCKKRPVSSIVRPVSEKQCVGGRKRLHCDNGSSNDEVSTAVTELCAIVKAEHI